MSNIQEGFVTGRLTRDPELNDTGRVLRLGIASNYRVKDGEEWKDEVSYFDVKVLGNRAKGLASFLEKGREVAVSGQLVQERWEAKDGGNRSRVVIIAREVNPMGPGNGNGKASEDTSSEGEPVAAEDAPPF